MLTGLSVDTRRVLARLSKGARQPLDNPQANTRQTLDKPQQKHNWHWPDARLTTDGHSTSAKQTSVGTTAAPTAQDTSCKRLFDRTSSRLVRIDDGVSYRLSSDEEP